MQVVFTKQFEKDIHKLTDKNLAKNIENVIQSVKSAHTLSGIINLKKLKNHPNAYRIRVGNYRIGIYVAHNIVEFSCFLHRKDVYKYFP